MSAPASLPSLVIEPAGDGYIPGVCNIGPWEIRKRWAGGIIGLAAAALLLVVLIALGVPPVVRVLVLLPAWGGAFSVLQARRRFCGAYAFRRISNFGTTYDTIQQVDSEAAHRADMAKVYRMTRDSFAFALVVTVIAVLLPL